MSLEAFISGKSSLSSSGALVPNQNSSNDQRRINESCSASTDSGSDNGSPIVLAERTSNLISSYRDYISGQEDEEMMLQRTSGIGSSAGSHTSPNLSFRNMGSNGSGSTVGVSNRSGGDPLLREWSPRPTNGSHLDLGTPNSRSTMGTLDEFYTPTDELWESDSNDSGDRMRRKRYHYTHPIYHSKKFRRVVMGVIVVAAVIGVISLSHTESKDANLPDWDEELKEVLQEEEEQHTDKSELQHLDVGMKDEQADNVIAQINVADVDKKEKPNEESLNAAAMVKEVIEESFETKVESSIVENVEKKEAISALSAEGIESITRHILCCSPTPDDDSTNTIDPKTRSSPPQNTEQTNLSESQAAAEYARAESHHPTWYNRSHGWTGTTYIEALEFCTEGGKQLCPYEVYCPTGPHHIPLGGYRGGTDGSDAESSSRAPISNVINGWVQVGSKNPCVQYTILNDEGGSDKSEEAAAVDNMILDEMIAEEEGVEKNDSKQLGDDGLVSFDVGKVDNNEQAEQVISTATTTTTEEGQDLAVHQGSKQEQMAQVAAAQNAASSSSSSTEPETQHLTVEQVAMQQVLASKEQEQEASPDVVVSQSSPENTSTAVTGTATTTDNFDMASVLHEKFKPLWLSAKEGWNGGSHDDAVTFCNSIRGKKLCPYSAMCPHGPGNAVMGGRHELIHTVSGEQYAPVMGGTNHWVMIGTKEGEKEATCMTHRQLEGKAPEWGLTGDRSEVKQHIMCCTVD